MDSEGLTGTSMGQVAHQAVEVSMGGLKRGCESEMKRRMEEGRKD